MFINIMKCFFINKLESEISMHNQQLETKTYTIFINHSFTKKNVLISLEIDPNRFKGYYLLTFWPTRNTYQLPIKWTFVFAQKDCSVIFFPIFVGLGGNFCSIHSNAETLSWCWMAPQIWANWQFKCINVASIFWLKNRLHS